MIESLEELRGLMRQNGAVRILAKKLAPNDNSKNQIYLGGDFSALTLIPFGEVETDRTSLAGSVRNRAKASVEFYWIDESGKKPAPNAQLILYPKYPEIRLSGLLKGLPSNSVPSAVIRVRDEGRVLFLGVTQDRRVLGFAAAADSFLARSLEASGDLEQIGVFLDIPLEIAIGTSRTRLLNALRTIHDKSWINSKKLDAHGVARPYQARNGGGYTLEAELGIRPNGYSEPDFLGWELKQYGVIDFENFRPKSPVTLLTPEPTGGFYRDKGAGAFIRRFGYPDKAGKTGRLNFGGVYACNKSPHPDTGLRLQITGFDLATRKITNVDGNIALVNQFDEPVAVWSFSGIIEHWNRKHAQAAYVPSLFRTPPPQYRFGARVQLCEKTDLVLFLSAIATGVIYYDPGMKLENLGNGMPKVKRRSQFRIRHTQLQQIYHQTEIVNLSAQISY